MGRGSCRQCLSILCAPSLVPMCAGGRSIAPSGLDSSAAPRRKSIKKRKGGKKMNDVRARAAR